MLPVKNTSVFLKLMRMRSSRSKKPTLFWHIFWCQNSLLIRDCNKLDDYCILLFMIIIWRYLLSQYIKVLSLSLVAFISVLLTSRLEEIAHFASLGAQGLYVLNFTLHQIPYILPIAIPISALISALLLIQRLSSSHELTALRAGGLSIKMILAPILIFAAYLSLLNFYIVSELATESHRQANSLKSELRQVNPLLILRNKHLVRLKGIYFDSLGDSQLGETASDIFLALPGKGNNQMNLLVAKNLRSSDSEFTGSMVTSISSMRADYDQRFDHLIIENMEKSVTSTKDFSTLMQKKVNAVDNDYLKLGWLLTRINESKAKLSQNISSEDDVIALQRSIKRGYTEIVRRISLAMAVFTFTLMGLSFGASIGRHQSRRSMLYLFVLAAFYLACFFAAKSVDTKMIAALCLYLVPHAIIIAFSLINLNKLSKGMEN